MATYKVMLYRGLRLCLMDRGRGLDPGPGGKCG